MNNNNTPNTPNTPKNPNTPTPDINGLSNLMGLLGIGGIDGLNGATVASNAADADDIAALKADLMGQMKDILKQASEQNKMWELKDITDPARMLYAFMTGGMGLMKEITLSKPNEPDLDKAMLTFTWKDCPETMKEFREVYATYSGPATGIGAFDEEDQRRFSILVNPDGKTIFSVYDDSESLADADDEMDSIYVEYETIGRWYYDETKPAGGLLDGNDDDLIDEDSWHFKKGEIVLFNDDWSDDEDRQNQRVKVLECRKRVAAIKMNGEIRAVSYDYLDYLDREVEEVDPVTEAVSEKCYKKLTDPFGKWEDEDNAYPFPRGSKVTVIAGPFKGHEGEVTKPGEDITKVRMNMLGKETDVACGNEILKLVE